MPNTPEGAVAKSVRQQTLFVGILLTCKNPSSSKAGSSPVGGESSLTAKYP